MWRWFGRRAPDRGATITPKPTVTTPQAIEPPKTESKALASAPDMAPPPALVTLATRLRLSAFEQDILLLCTAMELDTGIAGLCARAQGDSARAYPTFALALALFDSPSWEALSPERPLRYCRLIEINQPGGHPLTTSQLRADERIVNYLKGLNYLDDRLAPMLAPFEAPKELGTKPASQKDVEDTIFGRLRQVKPGEPVSPILLLGGDTPTKELVASSVVSALVMRLYRMPANLLPAQAADMESFARLWQRESLLLPGALYLDASNIEPESPAGQAVTLLLSRSQGLTFLDARDAWPGLPAGALSIEVSKPTAAEQYALWREALGEAAGENPSRLAAQFDLGAAQIRQIAGEAAAEPPSAPLEQRLWDTALAATRPRLDALAQHIEPKAKWDDIVLPALEIGLLHEIADQVSQRSKVYQDWGFAEKTSRGLGITALFAGASGTGKTMAAEILANHLRLGLHRVDLSSVVSKYIGETEKNLRRLFDAAEEGAMILFFDEADALFGKRSEVKDSHDRYANIEVNYLLQRMESYRGLAILATNTKSALDPAFVRRLRFIVDFPFPGIPERKAIWQKVFPAATPVGTLDFDRLARLNVTGGHIANIALNAAFRAAHLGTPVTMP
ncbi:MAG: AAA family ATPase, partial [Terriglobia bacterium]